MLRLRRFTIRPQASLLSFTRRLLPLLLLLILFGRALFSAAAEPVPLPLTPPMVSGNEPSLRVYFQQSQLKVVPDSGSVSAIAVSADGMTALIGAATYEGDEMVYVFTRSGVDWTQQAMLTATTDGPLALSADGSTALVGHQGSASVFTRSGTTWTLQAMLTVPDSLYESVALSPDGSTALIGTSSDDVGANIDQGSASIFTRIGTTWTQQIQLTASDGAAGDYFGGSVALSADGSTALVGATATNDWQGSAYVFTRIDTTWTQQARLTASDGSAGDYFSGSIALSSDGSTALIGASTDDVGANMDQGSLYVFTRSGTVWTQQTRLIASDGDVGDGFGYSIALSMDASTIVVSAINDNVDISIDQGSLYVFTRSGESWIQQAKLTSSDGTAGDYFGSSIALSGDGNLVLSFRFSRYMRRSVLSDKNMSDVIALSDDSRTVPKTMDLYGSVYIFQGGPNLLTNGDFETDADGDQQPDGWTATALTGDKLRCNLPDKSVACGGQCAYVFKGNPGETATLTQEIAGTGIDVGKDLILTVELTRTKLVASGKILFKVRFANGDKSKGKIDIPVINIYPPTKFHDYRLMNSAAVPVSSPVESIKVIVHRVSTGGKMFLDNLGLVAVDASNDSTTLPLPDTAP